MARPEDTLPEECDVRRAAELAGSGSAVLLDVREDEEWNTGHAPHARHLRLGLLDPTVLERNQQILVICRSGARSARATATLRQAGLAARNVSGGMRAWEAAGLPVTRSDGSPGAVA